MLTLLSPAKKLNTQPISYTETSQIRFPKETQILVDILQGFSLAALQSLMGLSTSLATLNFARYQKFHLAGHDEQPSHPALFLFQGDVYQSLSAQTLPHEALQFAKNHLAILSGLYGLLRPFDLIQPYRLEMGTTLKNPLGRDLYTYWRHTVSDLIHQILATHQHPVLLNLASTEYAKVVETQRLKHPMVTAHFKEKRGDTLKVIGIFAKKARGAMARFILTHAIDTPEDLHGFNGLDYRYQPALSDPQNLIFTR